MTVATRQLLSRPERQATILRGAATAFARTGYAATSMEDVAAASGITKLIVYRHFDSKEELYDEVVAETAEQLLAELHKLDGVETDEAPTRAARRQRVELTRRLLHLAHLGDRCRVQVMDTYFAYKEGSDPVEEPWSGAKDE